jgi:hypothetical protein
MRTKIDRIGVYGGAMTSSEIRPFRIEVIQAGTWE